MDTVNQQAWLLHCPGVIGLVEIINQIQQVVIFYITIGQAPRYLDRIMSLFGRVVYGMEHVQSITRTQVSRGASCDIRRHTNTVLSQCTSWLMLLFEKQLT